MRVLRVMRIVRVVSHEVVSCEVVRAVTFEGHEVMRVVSREGCFHV